MKITDELLPIYNQLKNEGFSVYTYTCESMKDKEIESLYWWENGRILSIQKDYFGGYNLSVSYISSRENGAGCRISEDNSFAKYALTFRDSPTWVNGVKNYISMKDFLNKQTVLTWYEIVAD
jgi:hypothetical protein